MIASRKPRRLAVLVLAALVPLAAGCNKVRARMTIREANVLFKAEKYEKAIEKYESALKEDPSVSKVNYYMGLAYLAMFQPASTSPKDKMYADKAIEHFKAFVETHPDDPRGPEKLVQMYLSAQRFDEAIQHLQSVLANNPADLKTIQRLATVYQKKGDFDNAVKWQMEQLKLITDPADKATVYYTLGALCWDRSYSYPDLEPTYRQEVIQRGLDMLAEAVKLRDNYFEAVSYQNLLFREKAKHEWDPVKKGEFLALADQYRNKAIEIRKMVAAARAATAATAAVAQ